LGTGRTACIVLDDCSYSRNFDLERGRAQGDNISPNTFNFGDQILILKIELDPRISAVWQHLQAPNFNLELVHDGMHDHFLREAAQETGKNESMADDNTTITLLNRTNLLNLRLILDQFAIISGLSCNYEKTCVLPVGPANPNFLIETDTSGFQVVNKIKLLGLEIDNSFENTDTVFAEIHEKIKNLISFWERFRLTLPGRISVTKNLIIPQINYLGCFLCPNENILKNIQRSLDNFALGGLNVAVDRRYLPPEMGGMGLFDIKNFLEAQRCSWIKRAYCNPIDNWRVELKKLSPNNDISLIRLQDVNQNLNPVLFNLVESFSKFLEPFTLYGKNYTKGQLFLNPAFIRSGRDNGLLDEAFFTRNLFRICKNKIRGLTFDQCFHEDNFKSKEQFHAMGIPMSYTVWMRLQSAVLYSKNKYSHKLSEKVCKSMGEFLSGFKKGSKKFRIIVQKIQISNVNVAELRTVGTYSNLTDTPVPDEETLKFLLKMWNCSFLPNDFREYLFKERNNCLPLNNRIANYVENVDERCSFCRIINPDTGTRESFPHLLLDCPVTRAALNGFLNITRSGIQGNNPDLKAAYWYGQINNLLSKDVGLIFALFRFCLWKCKIRRILPRARDIACLMETLLGTIIKLKPKIGVSIIKDGIFSSLIQARG
jgi:hypothetical protein